MEQKAAVLLERLVRDRPLPDGNDRVALVLTIRFCERNGRHWREPEPNVDAGMVERVATGEARLEEVVGWIEDRTESEPPVAP